MTYLTLDEKSALSKSVFWGLALIEKLWEIWET